jgi:hypothetical protein
MRVVRFSATRSSRVRSGGDAKFNMGKLIKVVKYS